MSVVDPAQQQFESQRQTVEAKLNAGQPLDIFDAIFLADYYPGVVKQLNPSPAPPLTPHERYEESAMRSYPSFEPQPPKQIVWPTETVTVGKSPTSAGRQVTIQRQPILESGPTLTGWLLGRSEQAKVAEQYLPSGLKTSQKLEVIAGVAASAESLINPRTPFRLSTSFIGGEVFGSLVIGYGIGKVTEPITSPYTKLISEKVSGLFKPKEMPSDYLSWDKDLSLKERLSSVKYYGQPSSQAVGVETAWDWSSPAAKGTAGMLEQPYGMPFYRAQTLGMAMPTKEWSSVRAVERFASERAIESQWGWESKVMGFSGGGLAETLMPTREAFETSETLKMQMPTRRIEEQWYTLTRGTPQTPFKVTLQRAIESHLPTRGMGGISATQELVFLHESISVPSPYTFPKEPVSGFTMDTRALSYAGMPQLMFGKASSLQLFGLIGLAGLARTLPQMKLSEPSMQMESLIQLEGLSQTVLQMQTVTQLQSLVQLQALTQLQGLTQLQSLRQTTLSPQKAIQQATPSFSSKPVPSPFLKQQTPFDFKRDMFKQKRMKKGGWEKRYMWEFPVKGAKEMWKAIK